MELTLFWTTFAKKKLRKNFKFHLKRTKNKQATLKLFNDLASHTSILKTNPLIGQREENLINRVEEFRYLVFKNYKIIYWINTPKNRVDISHIFDTRQDPVKMQKLK